MQLAKELEDDGVRVEHLDVGGGLGISYDGGSVPTAREYASATSGAAHSSSIAVMMPSRPKMVLYQGTPA